MIQFRRGTASAATSANEILAAGQPFVETDTNKLKIGDGSTAFKDLPYIGGSGGKKYASVVVGSEKFNSGLYSEANVDYWCTGIQNSDTLQAALDSMTDGGSLLLLPGQYVLDKPITMKYNTTIMGCGARSAVTCNEWGANIVMKSSCQRSNFRYWVNPSGEPSLNGSAISVNSDCTVSYMEIGGNSPSLYLYLSGSNINIGNCSVEAGGQNGSYGVIYSNDATNIRIHDCLISASSGSTAIEISGNNSSSICICNNDVTGTDVIDITGTNYSVFGNVLHVRSGGTGVYVNQGSTIRDTKSIILVGNSISSYDGNADADGQGFFVRASGVVALGNIVYNLNDLYMNNSGSGMYNSIVGNIFDPGLTNSGRSQVATINSSLVGNILLSSRQPSTTAGSQFAYNVSTHYTG